MSNLFDMVEEKMNREMYGVEIIKRREYQKRELNKVLSIIIKKYMINTVDGVSESSIT